MNWKKGMGGEARRGVGAITQKVGTSSAHFQEGPKLSPFDLVSPCRLDPPCLALLLGLQGHGKAAGMAEEGRS